jgi:predicted metal-dependent phosphoesterase TrpH
MVRHTEDSLRAYPPTWGKADLHIHTQLSDGGPSPGQVVAHVLRRTNLSVIAITDHDRIEGGLRARDAALRHGLHVVVGEEVSTRDGHLLALFIEERIRPGLSMKDTVAEVHRQGGLAIAAHPFDFISNGLFGRTRRVWTIEEMLSLDLDGVETLNGSVVRHVANARAHLFAEQLHVTAVGGSDAHHLAVIGHAHTRFPGHTAEDLRSAIIAGTAEAGGHPWQWRQYLGWIPGCLIPRTLRRAHDLARAYVLP